MGTNMIDNDDIFRNDFPDDPLPVFRTPERFKFRKGDEIKFSDTSFYVYEVSGDYVTIHIRKRFATAALFHFMDIRYDALYIGPMIEWTDGVHLTFKKKS